jgi:hypothetical protein
MTPSFSRLTAALLGGSFAFALLSCANPTELDLEGKVGEPCPVCSDACDAQLSFEFHCECDTCLWLGFDPEQNLLLHCITGFWQQRRACPGGVSVACTENDAYSIQCLDADGNELPLNN